MIQNLINHADKGIVAAGSALAGGTFLTLGSNGQNTEFWGKLIVYIITQIVTFLIAKKAANK